MTTTPHRTRSSSRPHLRPQPGLLCLEGSAVWQHASTRAALAAHLTGRQSTSPPTRKMWTRLVQERQRLTVLEKCRRRQMSRPRWRTWPAMSRQTNSNYHMATVRLHHTRSRTRPTRMACRWARVCPHSTAMPASPSSRSAHGHAPRRRAAWHPCPLGSHRYGRSPPRAGAPAGRVEVSSSSAKRASSMQNGTSRRRSSRSRRPRRSNRGFTASQNSRRTSQRRRSRAHA